MIFPRSLLSGLGRDCADSAGKLREHCIAGFELLWRKTTNPHWSVFAFVRKPERFVFKGVSTDKYFFAVRSVGKNGARSIAVPTVLRRR